MELDDELRRLLSGTDEDDSAAFAVAVMDAVKRRDLQPRAPRKPGARRPRKTMLAIASVRGSPADIELLVRSHHTLCLRALGSHDDPRIERLLTRIEAAIEARQGPVYDRAPIKDISRVKRSDYALSQLQLAARALTELLAPVIEGRPPGSDEQAAIAAGLRPFGLSPHDGWIVIVLREVERVRRRMLRHEAFHGETDELAQQAQAVLDRVRAELGDELPAHIDVALIGEILERYGFHSKGGSHHEIIGRRWALELLLAPGNISPSPAMQTDG